MSPAFPDVVLDYGVAAPKPVLGPQPLEDALGRVALLLRRAQVVFEYTVYDTRVGLELRTPGRALPAISGRRRMREHLVDGIPVHTEHAGRFPDTHPIYQACLANTKIQVHDVHPRHPPSSLERLYRKVAGGTVLLRHNQAVELPAWYIITPTFTISAHIFVK